jgi:hypothetical protein
VERRLKATILAASYACSTSRPPHLVLPMVMMIHEDDHDDDDKHDDDLDRDDDDDDDDDDDVIPPCHALLSVERRLKATILAASYACSTVTSFPTLPVSSAPPRGWGRWPAAALRTQEFRGLGTCRFAAIISDAGRDGVRYVSPSQSYATSGRKQHQLG